MVAGGGIFKATDLKTHLSDVRYDPCPFLNVRFGNVVRI